MQIAELLFIPTEEFGQLSYGLKLAAMQYAGQLGTLFGRSQLLLGIPLCDAPEYKHFVLDTLNESGLINREHSLLNTDLPQLREDPRVKCFLQHFNRQLLESSNPF